MNLSLSLWFLTAVIVVGSLAALYGQSRPRLAFGSAVAVIASFAALAPLMAATGDPLVGGFFGAVALAGVWALAHHLLVGGKVTGGVQ